MAQKSFAPRLRRDLNKDSGHARPIATGGDHAAAIAIDALSFLAADTDRLERFMATTGVSVASIRDAAGEPGFLTGVLDYVATDEQLLIAFAQAAGLKPAEAMQARQALEGPREWDHRDAV